MEDNPLFGTAADFVNHTSRHIFLTGKAGTGKTTFLKYIRENTRKKTVVVAPTGVAAINAGGVTMHSFFQLPLGPFLPVQRQSSGEGITDQYTLFKNIRVSEAKRDLFRELELLIIDEVSMLRCDMLDAIDAILRYFRKEPHVTFGGVQVRFIGDLFQLPPVMPDAEWALLRQYYASPFFFHSHAVQQAPPVYIELKKIYRQSQQAFIDILNRIRHASPTDEDLRVLNARRFAEPIEGSKYITLTTHNSRADRINAEEIRKLSGERFEFAGEVKGDFPDKSLPTDMVLELKEGAQIMFIRNDKSEERRYYNGKLATVKKIVGEEIHVVLAESEEELVLEKETWNNIRYTYNQEKESIDEERLGSFTQYPVRLAWAITIHKSQGLTFTHAIIDAGDSFAPGQVYVALSRCTSLDGLILRSKIVPACISTDPMVLEFAAKESDAASLGRLLHHERLEYHNMQLMRAFDLTTLQEAFGEYLEFIRSRKHPPRNAADNATALLARVGELQQVVVRFRQQMSELLKQGQEERLSERVEKATAYFSKALAEEVLTPLDNHLSSLKGVKKIRKYQKHVRELRNNVARKVDLIKRIKYGPMPVDGSDVPSAVSEGDR